MSTRAIIKVGAVAAVVALAMIWAANNTRLGSFVGSGSGTLRKAA